MVLETWSGSFASLLSLVRIEGSSHGKEEGGRESGGDARESA